MRQKPALARALLHRPPLLILDEPTTGLDALSAVAVREDLLNRARKEGVTALDVVLLTAGVRGFCRSRLIQ